MESRRTNTAIGLTLNLMLLFGVGAHAEQLAKSGTGTIHSGCKGVGTATPIGDKQAYWTGTLLG